MRPGVASSTASGAAMLRAAHLTIDGDPKVHEDTYAIRFLSDSQRERLAANDPMFQLAHVRASRGHIVGRHAWAESELAGAVKRGCRQYVLLGAGYDTSPLRLGGLLEDCVTFEVDHADTQAAKTAALADLAWPGNVRFVPMDFEADSLQLGCASRGGATMCRPSGRGSA